MADNENTAVKSKKPSSLPMLAVLFVVLGAAALLAADPLGWFAPDEEELDADDPGRRVLVDAKRDDISALEIKPVDGDAFRLEREDEQWWLVRGEQRHKANMERIDPLLDDLAGLRSESLATSSADEHANMEVDEEKAVVVSVYTGGDKPEVVMHVGKAAPGFQSSFVRLDGDEVYRSSANIKQHVGYAAEDYRSRKPWEFAPETATAVTVRPAGEDGSAQAEGALRFTKNDEGVWQHDGANASQNSLLELLKKLTELSAGEFADEATAEETLLAGRQPNIEVSAPSGEYKLTLGGKTDNMWFVQDQDGNVYKFSEYNLAFYRELELSQLTIDDVPKDAPVEEEAGEAAEEAEAGGDTEADEDGRGDADDTAETP